jgi:hypothetical protein
MLCTCLHPHPEPGYWHNTACAMWRPAPHRPDALQPGGRALAFPGVTSEQHLRSLVVKLANKVGPLDADRTSALLNLALIASVNRVGRKVVLDGLLAWFKEQDELEAALRS